MQVRPSPAPPGWRWLVLLPALGCLSCSGVRLNPVSGKVLNGKNEPLEGVLVTLHPKGGAETTTHLPNGRTQADGTFTLTTGDKEGAPAGEYVATFIWPKEVEQKKPKGRISTAPPDSVDQLRGAYANPKRSKFTVQIKNGDNHLEPFQLK
jgi:hypothetical protein